MKTDFFIGLKERAQQLGSLYCGSIQDRQNIISFLEMNDWFGQICPLSDGALEEAVSLGVLSIESGMSDRVLGRLEIWLKAYQRTNKEKLGLLAELGERLLPETTDSYMQYIRETGQEDEPAAWKLLDYLLSHLDSEVCELYPREVDALVRSMEENASLSACRIFSGYYENAVPGKSKWVYRFESRSHNASLAAYPLEDFACMSYCVFNEENWVQESMLEKACGTPAYANLWAFVAMHFICALRATDIVRLPKPQLPCSGSDFRTRILDGEIEDPGTFCREMKTRLDFKHLKPNKTAGTHHVPELKVFVPASLERPLGTIISIAASFCDDIDPGKPFLRRDTNHMRAKRFFGASFSKSLHGRSFSTRRANKSYLQGIEEVGDSQPAGNPKGYMLASLARSHKGGIGELPAVTSNSRVVIKPRFG